jgi:glycosyltransferase involved in cell wall biosynthesis
LSVVIPTWNRREQLRSCLESLEPQTASAAEFEVIVAVDGSRDGTLDMLAELQTSYSVTVVSLRRSGPSAARNAGAERAAGRLLLFIDDDVVASESLVSAHLEAHRASERVVGVGAIEVRLASGADRFARLRAHERRAHNAHLAVRPLTYRDCYGGNCSVSRALFEDVGGFAVDLPVENDFELAYRLHESGAMFVFVPDAVVTEQEREDWQAIFRDLEHRGRVAVELSRRHPAMLSQMELGGLNEQPRGWVALRRSLLALHVPPLLLARLGFFVPGQSRMRTWYRFVYGYSYWHGVRAATSGRIGTHPR